MSSVLLQCIFIYFIIHQSITIHQVSKMLIGIVVFVNAAVVLCVSSSTKFDAERDHVELLLPHYALHPKKAMQLALMEESLVATLRNIPFLSHKQKHVKKDNNGCESNLVKYLNEFEEYIVEEEGGVVKKGESGVSRASEMAENPNLLFKMIRRILETLLNQVYKSCRGGKWELMRSTVEETFTTANLAPPTERDLDDALLGIIRIHYIYGLSAADIQRGIFQDVHTNAILNFDDCMALVHKALELEADVLAYQWLSVAESLAMRDVNDNAIAYLQTGWTKLINLTGLGTIGDLQAHMGRMNSTGRQETMAKFLKYKLYETCRGETPSFHHRLYPNGLYCLYTNTLHPYFFINPLKVEVLSESPLVAQFYEVIGQKYRNFLSEATSRTMTRTETATQFEQESKYGDFITSISSLLQFTETEEQDQLLEKLDRKVSLLTGLAVSKKSRAMQVSIYGALGGYYDFHHDTVYTITAHNLIESLKLI